jgi:DNA-binding transcriptional regulator YiaG
MNALRELRHATGLGQREFAALLSIPLETLRPWDSGRRVASVVVLQRACEAAAHHARRQELLPLSLLAHEFHVHVRTLQAAVRTGRLAAHFPLKSVFGRPRRFATRAATNHFMATQASGSASCAWNRRSAARRTAFYLTRVRALSSGDGLRRQRRIPQGGC